MPAKKTRTKLSSQELQNKLVELQQKERELKIVKTPVAMSDRELYDKLSEVQSKARTHSIEVLWLKLERSLGRTVSASELATLFALQRVTGHQICFGYVLNVEKF
jgi:uridine phosphorylase